jgi:hypothetical protein
MLATRRVFRQFELVSIQIPNPCPQATTIRPTRQRLLELDAFRFQDGAEPLQVGAAAWRALPLGSLGGGI